MDTEHEQLGRSAEIFQSPLSESAAIQGVPGERGAGGSGLRGPAMPPIGR